MLNVAISGGTGFIGSYLIKYLLKKKINIFLLSRNKPKKINKKVKYFKFDLTKYKKFNYKKLDHIDTFIHLSWINNGDYQSKKNIIQVQKYHKNFLKKIILSGIKNIIISGTCYEYGKQEGCLVEKLNTTPTTKYGLAKLNLLKYLYKLKLKKNFSLCWMRIFYIVGKFKNRNSIYNDLINKINNRSKSFKMSSGNQVRDFIHINKISKIIYNLLNKKNIGIINVGSGKKKKLISHVNSWVKYEKIKIIRHYYQMPKHEPFKAWASTKKLKKYNL
tara:strand:+ start:4185 stop:5009 length:825 start_codon:yes stop_codon:yes gene_type:complete